MRTPANVAGHPVHPILVTIPIGTLVLAFLFDLAAYAQGGNPVWLAGAFGATVIGFLGVLASAVPGYLDYRALPATHPSKPTARRHMLLGVAILVLSAIGGWLQGSAASGAMDPAAATVLAFIIVLALLGQGWLGGSLVYRGRIAVTEEGEEPPSVAAERRRGEVPGGRKSF